MHDPCIVVHEIRFPWKNKFGYRDSIITIWHVDPEKDGTDNSCGWHSPKASKQDKAIIAEMVKDEQIDCFFTSPAIQEMGFIFNPKYQYKQLSPGDAFGFISAVWLIIARRKQKRWSLTAGEISEIMNLASNPVDGLRAGLFDDYERFLYSVMRAFNRHHREWWQHPRWHIHHWSIQFHPWQQIRRRFWDKCSKCGKRGFPKGVHAMGDWSGKRIWHSTCAKHAACYNVCAASNSSGEQ